jgi:hypothetical protein
MEFVRRLLQQTPNTAVRLKPLWSFEDERGGHSQTCLPIMSSIFSPLKEGHVSHLQRKQTEAIQAKAISCVK